MANGGFPLPASGGTQRLVEASHSGCAQRTRVTLPAVLPVRAVKRIFCEHCERLCDVASVVEVRPSRAERIRRLMPSVPSVSLAASAPTVSMPVDLDRRWLTVPLAALAVFAVLNTLNGGDTPAPEAPTAVASKPDRAPAQAKLEAKGDRSGVAAKASVPTDAQLVSESTFSLALPAGWDRVNPAAGATFAAVSADGTADATLWIQDNPQLDMASFEASSLQQLETLAGSARVVDRRVGPTVESSTITLAPKNVPAGAPTYEVVLRGAQDNWYYLATTHQAGAPGEAIAGVDLIKGSFLPLGGKG